MIECEASMHQNEPEFNFFGIGKCNMNEANATVSYSLYPRSLDNKEWMNHKVLMGSEIASFSIYHLKEEDHPNQFGFEIKDDQCFQNLVNLFNSTDYEQIVALDSDNKHNATLIGEVHLQ